MSAPIHASASVQVVPASNCVRSSTRMPARTPGETGVTPMKDSTITFGCLVLRLGRRVLPGKGNPREHSKEQLSGLPTGSARWKGEAGNINLYPMMSSDYPVIDLGAVRGQPAS